MEHFDYIIAGAGCSGRSLAMRLIPHLEQTGKRLLLVDKEMKAENDKTWCFWEQSNGFFEPIVHHQWENLSFTSRITDQEFNIQPYRYKMIRSIDFYAYTDQILSANKQVTTLVGAIESINQNDQKAIIFCGGLYYSADYLFSSLPRPHKNKSARYQYLLQHFVGWTIETDDSIFDPERANLMDFRTDQQPGTAFVYTLPTQKNCALVEYTVFSEQLLEPEDYEKALTRYIADQLNCKNYRILQRETGVIPMSDHQVSQKDGRITYLGTAGGFTKASTGYTFQFIQKHTAALANQLVRFGNPHIGQISPKRFNMYDGTLLFLLNHGNVSGEEIFSTLFKRNNIKLVLKFLDNETSIFEEIKIFATLQKRAFAIAFLKRAVRFLYGDKV